MTSRRAAADGDASPGDRRCAWCSGPIPVRARIDSVYCCTLHRQAAHRFGKLRRRRASTTSPLRFGYGDPPYPGTADRYYSDHPDFAGEVDHRHLIARLEDQYPDGWALSTSAAALPAVLALCPPDVRVAAWVRGERPAAHLRPLNAWEPVVYRGGRPLLTGPGPGRRTDALVYVARARLTDRRRVTGAKPAAFAWWLFDLLGALPGDRLDDLFAGSGGIARAWELYSSGPPTSPNSSFAPSNEGAKPEHPSRCLSTPPTRSTSIDERRITVAQ